LYSGKIKFTLNGSKLKGNFVLYKTKGRAENAWLLMKMSDEFVIATDILKQDASIRSGKTIEQMKKNIATKVAAKKVTTARKRQPKKLTTGKKKTASKKKSGKTSASVKARLSELPDRKFPKSFSPMLATLVDKPFDKVGWTYEVKWDGYRALGFMQRGKVDLKSRNDKFFNDKFYPIHAALVRWKADAIIDGEIVVLNDEGRSNFGGLQNWRSEADGTLIYYVFDLIWYNGKDLTGLPLSERRALLEAVLPDHPLIRLSDTFNSAGTEFFKIAQDLGLEGIMAKKLDSTYDEGDRTKSWLKIKVNKRQEVVIGGFTRNDDSSKLFSSLLVGVYDKGKLRYTGKIGTGFTQSMQTDMMKQFKPYITDQVPFPELPDINKPSRFRPNPPHATATFLKPKLVCEVSFAEMTSDGVMRHPSFEGMRSDKKASTVIEETETPTQEIMKGTKTAVKKGKTKSVLTPSGKRDGASLLNPTEETQVKTINGHDLKFTNLSKIFWPKEKYTKRDLINYYYQVAPYILPYLKDRPQSLNRHPNGINGKSFYQKDVTGKAPDWVGTYLYHSDADERDKHFMVATDEASVLYMASLGCIELNPWSSTVHKPDHPDWCIIDLDPDKHAFDKVIEAARVTHDLLERAGISSYCKTSGSTGLHIYIPLGAKYTYEQSKEFARLIATLVHKEIPRFTSIQRAVKDRGGKMYIDFLQNRPQATLACAYSVRPKPGASVSMPLHWDEVKKGLTMKDFTIANAVERIKSEGDLFKPVLGKGIDMQKAIKKLSAE
jgi:bifunctional non-homologous end joining protein LigD